jgi:predicted secreted acid phosphatase
MMINRPKNKRLLCRQQIDYQNSEQWKLQCEQAYYLASFYVQELTRAGQLIVIMDIDETLLDNRHYNQWLYDNGKLWPEGWVKYVIREKPEAVPGAKWFVEFLESQQPQVNMFVVSSRSQTIQAETNNQLEAVFGRKWDIHCLGDGKWDFIADKCYRAQNALIVDDDMPREDILPDKYFHICIPNVIYGSWET